jgi:hypothetical protein
MKKQIILSILCFSYSLFTYGQEEVLVSEEANEKNTALSLGVLMGGGSLVGADFEVLLPKTSLSLQIGAGISSFGGGINYHLKKRINSSFVSLQYLHQGFGDNYYASWFGPMFVYRSKKLFQAGIGVGSLVEKGSKWYTQSEKNQKITASLLFNVGVYF